MVQGRSKAVFKTWFAEQPQVWRASIKTVVMDGFTGFKTAAEEISEAVPVMDPFHVVRLAGGRPGRVPPTHPTRNPRPTRPGRGPALPGPTYPSHRAGLLTDKQKNRLDALFADDRHVQVEATRAIYGPPGTGPCFVGFLCRFGCGGGVRVGVAPEETAVLVGWRRRSGSRVLAGMKAEAVLHASRGADAGVIAETVERAERTVQEWPADWRGTRMRRVPAGHAGNRDAVEPVRVRKQEPEAILARPLGARGLDPPHAAPERGQRTRPSVDRQRTSQSFSDALPPTSRTVTPYPIEQNRDTWQTIGALDLLQRETEAGKIAVVPDNARPHHARALTGLHGPGRLLERIMPIHLSPYAPDHQPGRARPERGQERHRHHPARDTRRNPRRIRPTHHRPNIRPRLRTPPFRETRNDPAP